MDLYIFFLLDFIIFCLIYMYWINWFRDLWIICFIGREIFVLFIIFGLIYLVYEYDL